SIFIINPEHMIRKNGSELEVFKINKMHPRLRNFIYFYRYCHSIIFIMLTEEKQIFDLFDEFYLIPDEVKFQPVKEKEIPKTINGEFVFKGSNKKKMLFVHHDQDQLT